VAVNDVLRSFQAVVLATGATVPRALDIKGSESQGVHYAMDYLTAANRQVAHGTPPAIDARGKHVIVIGGGDTGSDCVGTANRQGAASVTQFAWSQRPHDQRTPYMPWPTYPLLLQTTSSHEEGCERVWAIATKAFLAGAEGRLRALQVVELSWEIPADGSKPVKYTEVPGSEREIPCGLALIAIGYAHPEHEGLLDQLGVAYDRRGNIRASERDYATSIPKVFAAGDARRGQSLVVWAISEGRECARRVDAFLTGGSLLEARDCNIVAAGCGPGPFPVTVPTPAG
jgi:glutamate synthase (NADPH/NADH) small chain